MDTLQQLKTELYQEYLITKKFFENFPDAHHDYSPHEKSMKMLPLATHIAEVFGWSQLILNTEVLDFGKGDYQPTILHSKEELLATLEQEYSKGKSALEAANEDLLSKGWRMEHNGHVLAAWSKYEAIRHSLNQVTHHRAQLGVYYRLLNVAVPGSYGPSADDESF